MAKPHYMYLTQNANGMQKAEYYYEAAGLFELTAR